MNNDNTQDATEPSPASAGSLYADVDGEQVLTNRQKSRRAKLGLHWCCGCDANLVGQGDKCSVCGYCHNPKKTREPR